MSNAYEAIVTQDGNKSENDAVSDANSHIESLTDGLGLEIDIFDTNVYGGTGKEDYGIGVCFATEDDLSEDEEEDLFETLDEDLLVETYEGMPYERLD